MNLKRLAAIAACAALVTGAAGCGGDDDDGGDSTSTETLTKEEWITQADQICADGDAAIDEAVSDAGLGPDSSEEDLTAFYSDTVIPNIADQRDQIEALPVPEGEEDAIGDLTDALDQAVSDAEADPNIINSGNDVFADVNQQAQDYGLTSCGDGAGS